VCARTRSTVAEDTRIHGVVGPLRVSADGGEDAVDSDVRAEISPNLHALFEARPIDPEVCVAREALGDSIGCSRVEWKMNASGPEIGRSRRHGLCGRKTSSTQPRQFSSSDEKCSSS